MIRSFLSYLLDEIFPPLCLCCGEKGAPQWFCSACWQLLSLPNPEERCRHCFENSQQPLCFTCQKSPALIFPKAKLFDPSLAASILQSRMDEIKEALSSMAFLLCVHLGWDNVDTVMAVPDEEGSKSAVHMAKFLAHLLGVPYVKGLERTHQAFLQPDLAPVAVHLQTGNHVLLFDAASRLSWLQKASRCLCELFPKKANVLTLFGG